MRMRHPQLRKSKRNFGLVEPAGCNLTPTERPSECISTPTECNLTPLQFKVQKWGVNQHPIFNSVASYLSITVETGHLLSRTVMLLAVILPAVTEAGPALGAMERKHTITRTGLSVSYHLSPE